MAGLRLEIRVDDKGTATIKKIEGAHGALERKVVAGSKRMSRAAAGVQKRWKAMATTLKRFSRIGVLAIAALGIAAVVTGAKFEQSMANVAAVSGATATELNKLAAAARGLGATTAFTASEAADAMMALAQAGQTVEQIMTSSSSVLLFAGAAQTGMADSAETLVQTLAQFNLAASQSDRVVNLFAASMSSSLLNAERLREGLSQVGATAAAVGLTLEGTVGVLGQLNNAGQLGGIAGTRLKNVLVRLAAPNAVLKRLLGENAAESVNFADKMEALGKSGATAGEIFKSFGRIAAPAVLTLMQQGRQAMDEMEESITGTRKAHEMFAIQMNTVGSKMKIFKSQMQENMIAVFTALRPTLFKAITGLTRGMAKMKPIVVGLVATFGEFIKANEAWLVPAAKVVGVLGVIALILAFKVPIAIGLAIAGILKLGDFIRTHVDEIKSELERIVTVARSVGTRVWDVISWPFRKLAELAQKAAGVFKRVFPDAAEAIEGMLGVLKEKGGEAVDFIVDKGKAAAGAVAGAGGAVVAGVRSNITKTKALMDGFLTDIKKKGEEIGGAVLVKGTAAAAEAELNDILNADVKPRKPDISAIINAGAEAEDARRAQLIDTIGIARAHEEDWLAARLELIRSNFDEEETAAGVSMEKHAEIRIERSAAIAEARMEHEQAVLENFLESNQVAMLALESLGAGYDALFAQIARGELKTKKIREAVINSVRATFVKGVGEMIKFWIKQTLFGLLVTDTAKKKSALAEKFDDAKSGARKAFSAFAGIPIIGPILGAAAAAAAFAFLMAFQRGGNVPGVGQGRDTVPAILEPQEFVIRRVSAQAVGAENLEFINRTGQLPPGGQGGGDVNLSLAIEGGGGTEEIEEYIEEEVVPTLRELNERRRGVSGRRR